MDTRHIFHLFESRGLEDTRWQISNVTPTNRNIGATFRGNQGSRVLPRGSLQLPPTQGRPIGVHGQPYCGIVSETSAWAESFLCSDGPVYPENSYDIH